MSRRRTTLLSALAVLGIALLWALWGPSTEKSAAPAAPGTRSGPEAGRAPEATSSPEAVAGPAPSAPAPGGPEPAGLSGARVDVTQGLSFRLQSREAAELALSAARRSFGFAALGDGSRFYPTDPADGPAFRVTSVVASSAPDLPRVDRGWRGDPEHYGDRDVWMVRIEGPFRFQAGPPGTEPTELASGFYVIDDASGEILSWGVP